MKATKLLVAALVIAGLAGSTFSADAKSKKHHHKTHSMSTDKDTSKSNPANPSSQGNAGPGTTNDK
ncbi:MAG: hypothetical protein WA303_16085 [Bradyrhizobium sp.]|jgi:hypothetical protein